MKQELLNGVSENTLTLDFMNLRTCRELGIIDDDQFLDGSIEALNKERERTGHETIKRSKPIEDMSFEERKARNIEVKNRLRTLNFNYLD